MANQTLGDALTKKYGVSTLKPEVVKPIINGLYGSDCCLNNDVKLWGSTMGIEHAF
jgi:hypothetical protein